MLAACSPVQAPETPSPSPFGSVSSTATTAPVGCVQPSDPNSHVYNPNRLKVLNPCIEATGILDFIRKEADGDLHIGLKLDPIYASLVNDCNSTCLNGAEHGDLVLEPVCVGAVTQSDAVSACAGYHNPMTIPAVGTHVKVKGTYVLDIQHGWTEIHPLVEISTI